MMDNPPEATRRRLIGSGGAVSTAALAGAMLSAFAGRAEAAAWTAQETANVKVVNDFLHALKPKDMGGQAAFLHPEVVYRMTETTPPDRGYAAIAQRLAGFVDNADQIVFEILDTQAMGPIVINRRIDRFVSKTRPLLFEGVGVFFVQGGKIKEWTDYTIRAVLANEWPAAAR